jgi:exonuclease III
MLGDFLRRQEIDVMFLQEVTQPNVNVAQTSICTNGRETAIVTREIIPLTNVVRIQSGRDIAAEVQGVWLVNIYAPSGAEKKIERETFFNIDFTLLLKDIPTTMILGGDFNCVLAKTDCNGHCNFSQALNVLVKFLNWFICGRRLRSVASTHTTPGRGHHAWTGFK